MNVGVHMNNVSCLVASYNAASVALTLSPMATAATFRGAVALFLGWEHNGWCVSTISVADL